MTVQRLRRADISSATRQDTPEVGEFGVLIGGVWQHTDDPVEVRSPFDGSLVAVAHHGGPKEVEAAIVSVVRGFETTRTLPSWKRAEVLERTSEALTRQADSLGRILSLEAGKPLKAAIGEIGRAAFTFKVAAEESKRLGGEMISLDWLPGNERREAHLYHVPRGPITGITPFNFPMNLVAHKVAPALAAGNSIVLRPDSQTPVSAHKLAEIILDAGWPADGIAVVPTRVEHAAPLVEDDRIKMLSFTGSPGVGWMLKRNAGRKPVALELGGNAGVIVHHDADVAYAAERVAWGGFTYSGQACISVQRVYIHRDRYDAFVDALIPKVKALKVGDPSDDTTDIGPVIDMGAAERIEGWVEAAVSQGATVLSGGTREGNLWQPTVLADVREDMSVSCNEVFGPIVVLYRYDDVDDAIAAVDQSDYGLQAGLFTNDLSVIRRATEQLEVGGLNVNDVSTFRMDHMPYGGVKHSGFGREGVRFAIEEMTERKLVTYNHR